jgi:hypothetical protein
MTPRPFPSRITHRASGEQGVAMVQAVIVTVMAGLVVTLLSLSAINSTRTATRQAQRSVALPVADSAVVKYLFALQTNAVGEGTGYVLNRDAMDSLASSSPGGAVWANSRFVGVDEELGRVEGSITSQGGAWTLREPLRSNQGLFGYWQMYHVIRPDDYDAATARADDDHSLVVYMRAWVGDPSGRVVSKPRIVRVQFRPGFFSDYQMVTDGPLTLGAGMQLDGPAHTNGYRIGPDLVPTDPEVRVKADAVSCGPEGKITTAFGTIDRSVPAACLDPGTGTRATGKVVDFLQTEGSFESIRRDAGVRTAVFPYTGATQQVVLSGADVSVNGRTVTVGGARPLALLFEGDVSVRGTLDGRLSIAAQNSAGSRPGAANIFIAGDVGIPMTGDSATNSGKDALGLIAQGSVVVPTQLSGGPCVTRIDAALIAETGRVGIPANEITPVDPPSRVSACAAPLRVHGSIASHLGPILLWRWGVGGSTGYATRRYQYNTYLKENPPPYFPRASVWRVAGFKEANYDCLVAARLMDRSCR